MIRYNHKFILSIQVLDNRAFTINDLSITGIFYNERQKDCLWKQRSHYGLENGSLGFIETLHKQ